MNIFQVIFMGIIEGLTEFLPVSSTFHLIVTARMLGITQTDFQKLFEVVIQSGAIAAVAVLYFKELISNIKLIKLVLTSFLPTAIVGLVLYKLIKGIFFENFLLQIIVFAGVGILFIIFERFHKNKSVKKAEQINYKEAFLVGIIQSLAIIPGVSRAGAVILSMMYLGVKRDESAKFSFLLALPTILAATLLDLVKMRGLLSENTNITYLLLGTFVSFICAFLLMKWFIGFLQDHTLVIFGWYRIILTFVILIFSR